MCSMGPRLISKAPGKLKTRCKNCGTSSRYSLKAGAFHSIQRRYLNVKDILLTYQGQVARFQLLACNLLLVAQEIVASFTC